MADSSLKYGLVEYEVKERRMSSQTEEGDQSAPATIGETARGRI